MVSPTDVMPTIATTAMSAASSPYSTRSWPSSRRTKRSIAVSIRAMSLAFRRNEERSRPRSRRSPEIARRPATACLALRCGRERRRDLAEDGVHVGAGERDGADGDERDERDEQRVLEQV